MKDDPNNSKLLKKAFKEFSGPRNLYRRTYKYVDCGPNIGFQNDDGYQVWGDELPETWLQLGRVEFILVSSIVEGVDEGTGIAMVDLRKKKSPKMLLSAYWEAVSKINQEAKDIWNRTHGCPSCGIEDDYGDIPVNPICKNCHGQGMII